MAHPVGNEHRADKVMKDRVGKITAACRARGGGVHDDEAEDRKLIRKEVKKTALRASGGAVKARADKVSRAKGGRVHKGHSKTNVNVIVAPGGQKPLAGVGGPPPMMPPGAGAPPPMPPKPPMMPMPPAAMGPSGVGGMPPPMPPRSDGGRAYKKGGRIKEKMSGEKKHGKHEKPYKMKADGGSVPMPRPRPEGREPQPSDLYEPKDQKRIETQRARGGKVGGIAEGYTRVQHSGNKSDTQNIGRGPAITRAAGGPIYSEGAKGKQMSWNKPSMGLGGGGGKERKAAAKRLNPKGHEPWTKDAAT